MRTPRAHGESPRRAMVQAELDRLQLSFPLWLFDPTSPAYPRPLKSVPPGTRPARIIGWAGGHWEYGMVLEKPNMARRTVDARRKIRSIGEVLNRMKFDESFDDWDYRAVLEDGREVKIAELEGLSTASDWITTITRSWDDTVLWQRDIKFDSLFDGGEEKWFCDGLAMRVESVDDLIRTAGVAEKNLTDMPMKAQFDFTDDQGGSAKGVVYNGRVQDGRGIIPNAAKEYNDRYLRGSDREAELGTIGR